MLSTKEERKDKLVIKKRWYVILFLSVYVGIQNREVYRHRKLPSDVSGSTGVVLNSAGCLSEVAHSEVVCVTGCTDLPGVNSLYCLELFVFDTGFHCVTLDGLELAMDIRLALNSQRSTSCCSAF